MLCESAETDMEKFVKYILFLAGFSYLELLCAVRFNQAKVLGRPCLY